MTCVPRSEWQYAGGGYVILRNLLSDATGLPFVQLMRDAVPTDPGMTHSTSSRAPAERMLSPEALSRLSPPLLAKSSPPEPDICIGADEDPTSGGAVARERFGE